MEKIIYYLYFIGSGISMTMELLIFSLIVGAVLGVSFSILHYQGIFVKTIDRFVSIVRGTPLILQLSFVYFLAPSLIGIKLGVVAAGIVTFGLNSSAYLSEILRSGIEHLPKGQFEAAKTLQIPAFYTWKDIILPQVFKNVWPVIVNEDITLLKETALISTIGGMDLMRKAQMLSAEEFTYFAPICIAGLYYYGLVLLIEYIGRTVERRMLVC